MRSLALALIEKERIETTDAKARELRAYIEKLVTRAKKEGLFSRRILIALLGNNKEGGNKLMDEIAPRYKERHGGYTRIVKLPRRGGDASPMALIEFV